MIDISKYAECIHGDSRVTFGDGHLGGCNIYGDPACECPKMWKFLKNEFCIRSVVDIGCGFGYHTKYFKEDLNLSVLGIEGSTKVAELALIPEVVCHDYTTGPFLTDRKFDLGWCIEFVEHVEEQYSGNFLDTFRKCKYLAMTHGTPGQAGYHHVNCQPKEYWVKVLADNGFHEMSDITDICRHLATEDFEDYKNWRSRPQPKVWRGPAANANDHRKDDVLVPWFAINGLVFKNVN